MSKPPTFVDDRRRRPMVVAGLSACLVAGWLIAVPAAIAQADCTGSDFGAGSGCPPPDDSSGSGGGGGESWPPTSVDWPPSQSSDSGGKGDDKNSKATPIVMPNGQQPPVKATSNTSDSDGTSAPPTPIVPVGPMSTATSPTAIVSPIGPTP